MQTRTRRIVTCVVVGVVAACVLLYFLWPAAGKITLDEVESADKGEATGEGRYYVAAGWIVTRIELTFEPAGVVGDRKARTVPCHASEISMTYKGIAILLVSDTTYRVQAVMHVRQENGTGTAKVVAPQVKEIVIR